MPSLFNISTSIKETTEALESIQARPRPARTALAVAEPSLGIQVLTALEAKELYGVDLPGEDWFVKLVPNKETGQYNVTYITPDKWKITHEKVAQATTPGGPAGWATVYISPSGKRYTQTELDAEIARRTPFVNPNRYMRINKETGQFEEVSEAELTTYHPPQQTIPNALAAGFNAAIETMVAPPQQDIESIKLFARDNPDAFADELLRAGRSPETENLVKQIFPEITDLELDMLLPPFESESARILRQQGRTATITDYIDDYIKKKDPELATTNLIDMPLSQQQAFIDKRDRLNNEARAEFVKQYGEEAAITSGIMGLFTPPKQVTELVAGAPAGPVKTVAQSLVTGQGQFIGSIGSAARYLGYKGIGQEATLQSQTLEKFAPDLEFKGKGDFWTAPLLSDEFNSKLYNFFLAETPRMIPYMVGLMPLSIAGGAIGGVAAGGLGLGAVGTAILTALGGGSLSAIGESLTEAGRTYDDLLATGMAENEARKKSNTVFIQDVGLLTLTNSIEFGIAFVPIPKVVLDNKYLKFALTGVGGYAFSGFSEGSEEVFEDIFVNLAEGKGVNLNKDEIEVFALAAFSGIAGDAIGNVSTAIEANPVAYLTTSLENQRQAEITRLTAQGLPETIAQETALDKILHTDEGKAWLSKIMPQIKEGLKAVLEAPLMTAMQTVTPPEGQVSAPKEPWQMTFTEFSKTPHNSGDARFIGNQFHHDFVKEALSEGKPVPAEVLADYPDLQKGVSPEQAARPQPAERVMPQQVAGTPIQQVQGKPEAGVQKELQPTAEVAPVAPGEARQPVEAVTPSVNKGRWEELPQGVKAKAGQTTQVDANTGKTFIWLEAGEKLPTPPTIITPPTIQEVITPEGEPSNYLTIHKQEMTRILTQFVKARDILQAQKEFYRMIRDSLPVSERGPLLAVFKAVKDEASLQAAIAKLDLAVDAYARRQFAVEIQGLLTEAEQVYEKEVKGMTRIEKTLESVGVKRVRGVPTGRLTAETQEQIDQIKAHLHDNRAQVQAQIEKNVEAAINGTRDALEVGTENELLYLRGIDGMSADELAVVLSDIKHIIETGRLARWDAREKTKAWLDALRTTDIAEITGGQGIKPGAESLPSEATTYKGWLTDRLGINKVLSFGSLLEKLSKFVKGEPFQSNLYQSENMVRRVMLAEKTSAAAQIQKVIDGFKETFKVSKNSEVNNLLKSLHNDMVKIGTFRNTDGVSVNLEMTGLQMVKKYMEMLDPTLTDTFVTGMKWTPQMMQGFLDAMTPEMKAWGDWQLQFYRDYYASIDAVFSKEFGVHLPYNPFYSPINRDFTVDIQEHLLTYQDMMSYASVKNGSIKSRVENTRTLKFTDANDTLIHHITQMEHFKAWTDPMHELRGIFGNTEVRQAILQYHGEQMLDEIDLAINQFANPRYGVKVNRVLDYLRRSFTLAVIGLKPVMFLQQLPTVLGYMTEMPMGDFITGTADFWSDPIANYKWMMENSDYIKQRYQAGFDRDIQFVKQRGLDKVLKQGELKQTYTKIIFSLMEVGDKFGVLQGWWAKYRQGIKAGLTNEQAQAEANASCDRTQNTSSLDTLSSIQRGGSWMKLLTMYQAQPAKYFEIIANNMRNFQYGRGSRVTAAKNIIIAWVILPAMYELISSAFQYKKEKTWKDILLAPMNDLLIIGPMIQSLSDWIAKENFEYNPSPILSTFDDVQRTIQKGWKIWVDYTNPYTGVSMDDVIALVEYMAKIGGQLAGIPTPYLIQVEKGLRSGDLRSLVFSKWALTEPTADLPGKTQVKEKLLGTVIEDNTKPVTTEDLGSKKPVFYGMLKLNSDFGDIYSKTLPSDITKEGGHSALAISWAQKELSRSKSDILPNMPLYKIAEMDEGFTIEQYYAQWQARLRIDNLPDLIEFDKTYGNSELGNITNEQKNLLVSYQSLTKSEQAAFLKLHPELLLNPHTEWLKANPEGNALLSLWSSGDTKLLTIEAYNKAVELVKELNIPADALANLLPPKEVAKASFSYNDAVDKFGGGSSEAMLIRAENPALNAWLGLDDVTTPIDALKLKVEPIYAGIYDKLHKDTDPEYIRIQGLDDKIKVDENGVRDPNGKTAFEWANDALKATKIGDLTYRDVDRKIEAIEQGLSNYDAQDKWVKVGQIIDKTSSLSPQVKQFMLQPENRALLTWASTKDNPVYENWEDWDIRIIDIDVKYEKEDAWYNGIGERWAKIPDDQIMARTTAPSGIDSDRWLYEDAQTRRGQLADAEREQYKKGGSKEYWTAILQREAYGIDLPEEYVPNYVEYYQLPTYGSWQDRYRQEHPEFEQAFKDARLAKGGKVLGSLPDKIPLAPYDMIYEEYKDQFTQYDKISGSAARASYFEANPDFHKAYYRRKAYGEFFPEGVIDDYVTYYTTDWGTGWADARFLNDHRVFYDNLVITKGLKDIIDFDMVPSEMVESAYEVYKLISGTKAKEAYRRGNPDLDSWLFTMGYVTRLVTQTGPTTSRIQKTAESIAATVKLLEELRNKYK